MSRLRETFASLRRRGRKALSVFLTAGYPSLRATEPLALDLAESGADFFELGFPFSDPIADGPTIQKSSEAALKNGITWPKFLSIAERIRAKSRVPLIFMGYSNTLFRRGWAQSARQLADAGFDGAIVPDMIPEESAEAEKSLRAKGLDLVRLLAPTSSAERVRAVAGKASGFVYCVSVTGVTGARKKLPAEEIRGFLRQVKRASRVPALLGFGISKPEQCRQFPEADGFIVGSALVQALAQPGSSTAARARARRLVASFSKVL